jgi:hypothetical protein
MAEAKAWITVGLVSGPRSAFICPWLERTSLPACAARMDRSRGNATTLLVEAHDGIPRPIAKPARKARYRVFAVLHSKEGLRVTEAQGPSDP